VRDSPSLVWGRPAKSVVERPRGFNSHIPRQLLFIFLALLIHCKRSSEKVVHKAFFASL
jgi:hypothetical protein